MIYVEPPTLEAKDFRTTLFELKDSMVAHTNFAHFPVVQYFAPGMYAREIRLPAGSIAIGKIHKHAHLNVISVGRGVFITDAGRVAFQAPHTFVSAPGTMRAVQADTDVVWTTFHATDAMGTPDEMKDLLTVERFEDVPAMGHNSGEAAQ